MKQVRAIAIFLIYIVGFFMALHAVTYLSLDNEWGFLEQKDIETKTSLIWQIAFYLHLIGGAVAIIIGPFQFMDRIRIKYRQTHRKLGAVYIGAILLGGTLSLYTAIYADGGLVGKTGFMGLGIAWLFTTIQALLYIKSGNTIQHQNWMVRSYAVTMAAVSFRIIIGVLIASGLNFEQAYAYSSWLCWIINLGIAGMIIRYIGERQGNVVGKKLRVISSQNFRTVR